MDEVTIHMKVHIVSNTVTIYVNNECIRRLYNPSDLKIVEAVKEAFATKGMHLKL